MCAMLTERRQLPDVNEWGAQHFQLIAFSIEGQQPVPAPLRRWEEMTGTEPATTQAKPFYRVESGEYQGATLTVASDPLKIAWIATPLPVASELTTSPPTFRPFSRYKDWFVGVMSAWLPHCPPVYRLAFHAKLIRPVEGGPAGASRLLNLYLSPKVQVDSDSSDFLYRVNRKCVSATPDLTDRRINRIATWSAMTFTMQMQILGVEAMTGAITMNAPTQPTEHVACSLELDINTILEQKNKLPPERLPQLFQELATLGTEIAENGDVT